MAPSPKTQRIVVRCPGCRKESTCRRELIGRPLRCKNCSTTFRGVDPEAAPEAPARGPAAQKTALDCPGCGRRLNFRTQYLGQVVACKHCDCTFVARGDRPAEGGTPEAATQAGKRPATGLEDGLLSTGRPTDEGPGVTLENELAERPGESLTIALRDLELRLGQVRARQNSEKKLRLQLDEARTRLAVLGEQVAELEEEALKARALEDALDEAREQLDRSRVDLAGQQELRRRDQEKLDELETQLREARAREAALLSEYRAARDEIGQHRDADERLARLDEEVRALRTEEARWAADRLAWEQERARLEEERAGAGARLEEARLLEMSLAEERAKWDRERAELLARAEARIAELLAAHGAECLSLRDELESVRSRSDEAVNGLRKEREAQRLEIERLGRDVELARAEAASLAAERDELLSRAESRDPEVRGLEERLASIEAELASQAEAHRLETSALEDRLAVARRGEAEARTRADEIGRQMDELRIAIERQQTHAEEESIAHRKALAEWESRLGAQRLELEAALAEERLRHESELRLRDAAIEEAHAKLKLSEQEAHAARSRAEAAEARSSQPPIDTEDRDRGDSPRGPEPPRVEAEPSLPPVAGESSPVAEPPAEPRGEDRAPLAQPTRETQAPAALPVDAVLDDIRAETKTTKVTVDLSRADAARAEGPVLADPSDSGERLAGADRVANPARGEGRRWLPRIGFTRRLPAVPTSPSQDGVPAPAAAEPKRQDDRPAPAVAVPSEAEIDRLHTTLDNLYEQGRLDEATELARRLVEMAREHSGGRGRLYAVLMNKLGTLLYRRGENDEAGDLFVRSEALLVEAGEGRSPLFIAFLGNRAMLLRDQGDLAGARRVLDDAKVLGEEILDESHPLREMIRYVRMMIGQGVPTQQLYSGVSVVTAGL